MALTTINSDGVKDDSIVNADIKSDAAIAGTKVAPNFGSQNIVTTGNTGIGAAPSTGYQLQITGQSGYDDIARITAVGTNMGPRINLTPTGTGTTRINATANNLELQTGGETALKAVANGAVELYYDASKKIETYSDGCILTDGVKLALGNSEDLQLYHDGSDSYINESGTGDLIINSSHIVFQDGGTEVFETTATGARFKDSKKLLFGSGNDLEIFHDGSHSYIKDVGVGSLRIDSNSGVLFNTDSFTVNNSANSEAIITGIADGAVSLYYNNTLALFTTAAGADIRSQGTSVWTKYQTSDGTTRGYVYANDSYEIGFLNSSGGWRLRVENDGDYAFSGSNISDRDRKDNITTVTGTSLDKITKLVPKTYNWKNLDGITPTDKTFTGFIAQEVKEHLPSLVTGTDGQKNMAVDYNGILAHAVKAITELSAEVEALKAK